MLGTYLFDSCHCRILLVYWTASRVPPLIVLFFSGAVFWLYQEKIYYDSRIFVASLLISLGAIQLGFFYWVEWITLPYIILWVAINLPLSSFDKQGDYSYGIYIYSFPIQQILIQFNLEFTVGLYFILSILLTTPFAILSWHLIEKPCINLKNMNKPKIERFEK